MMEMPIIRLDISRLREQVAHAFVANTEEVNRLTMEEVDKVLTEDYVRQLVSEQIRESVPKAIKRSVERYFEYGEGAKHLDNSFLSIIEPDSGK